MHDTRGAHCLLTGLAPLVPHLRKIWADAGYRGKELASWYQAEDNWDLEVVERTPGTHRFSVSRVDGESSAPLAGSLALAD